ncbi:hypothetical protein LTS18_011856, partial [Coniosporium uncinatum]
PSIAVREHKHVQSLLDCQPATAARHRRTTELNDRPDVAPWDEGPKASCDSW